MYNGLLAIINAHVCRSALRTGAFFGLGLGVVLAAGYALFRQMTRRD
ncbi:hypothetical protein [Rhizobium rhizophilum]|nr:hypothetical protein [Rhizobium rhizophilum]